MDKNITATMTDAEKEFANAIADGMNAAFKKADMQNNLAIGISSAATIGGLALAGVGIYTAMKSNVAIGATAALVGIIATGIGGYKLIDSIERKKLSSAFVKGMEEYYNMPDDAK